jgi:hypothetical protein
MYALTLAGIPISIGANEAVHQQRLLDEEAEAEERQEEFYLDVFCDAKSRKKDEVNGAIVVLKDGKVRSIPPKTRILLPYTRHPMNTRLANISLQVRLWPKDPETGLPKASPNGGDPPHPITGLYVPFPAHELPHRPMPCAPTLGLVSTVPSSPPFSPESSTPSTPSPTPLSSKPQPMKSKPRLNWLYASHTTRELLYGPRHSAKSHKVGPWDWTDDEQGLTLDWEECFVAVEEEKGGFGWSVYWDREDDCLKEQGVGKEKRVLRCSLERRLVEEKEIGRLGED